MATDFVDACEDVLDTMLDHVELLHRIHTEGQEGVPSGASLNTPNWWGSRSDALKNRVPNLAKP